jgi:hypothetical protein
MILMIVSFLRHDTPLLDFGTTPKVGNQQGDGKGNGASWAKALGCREDLPGSPNK